jgi:ABC-type Fe3+-hydroxamate transport system substrate-binding protein
MTNGASSNEPSYQELKKDPIWNKLDAVKNHKIKHAFWIDFR